jgi:hypothetical protein
MAKYQAQEGLLFHGKWKDLETGETHRKRPIPKGTKFETDEPLLGKHKKLAKSLTSGSSAPKAETSGGNGEPPKASSKGGK